jgi:hypothetical protein
VAFFGHVFEDRERIEDIFGWAKTAGGLAQVKA